MRRATGLLLVLLAACATAGTKTLPQGLTLTLVSAREERGQLLATLKLSNSSSQPFHYRAYSLNHLFPASSTEVRRGLRWVFLPMPSCGFGVQTVTLNPGETVVVTTPVWYRWPNAVHRRVRVRIPDADGRFIVRSAGFDVPPAVARSAPN
jgi:hypothetical protein